MGRIFGPVPSRRLGRSLGVDVVPYKTCTFDCIYCECGATTDLTCERTEFFPLEDILSELRDALDEIPTPPDVATLSGAGEPALYSRLGELIDAIKNEAGIPVAVITNSSLLYRPDVREEMMKADIVLPSLDSALQGPYGKLNRPHSSLSLGKVMDGLGAFLDEYEGRVLFEILLLEGYNTSDKDLAALAAFLDRHRVDSIQLNTAVRPGTIPGIAPLTRERLEAICSSFGPKCEIVASVATRAHHEEFASADRILSMIERRPCTAEDIHRALGVPVQGVIKLLSLMAEDGTVTAEEHGGETFYTASDRESG